MKDKSKHKLPAHVVGFKVHLERLGYSKTSVSALPNAVKSFFEFSNKTLGNIISADIVCFYNHLQERPNKRTGGGLSESYIHHHIYALKVFLAWQMEIGSISENPMNVLDFPSPQSKPREILTIAEIQLLYQCCESDKETAVLGMFYGCGLRRTEGEKLNLKDIHFRQGLLYVREGKGDKRRVVPLNEKVSQDLKNYAFNQRNPKKEEQAFVTNNTGRRTSGPSFNKILRIILERTGITKEITLHCLRHSIATHLLESGLSVEYVRDFLGHKHLESTQIYTRVNQKQLYKL